jgi:hypothetical protein
MSSSWSDRNSRADRSRACAFADHVAGQRCLALDRHRAAIDR